jgi:hypothetical protein
MVDGEDEEIGRSYAPGLPSTTRVRRCVYVCRFGLSRTGVTSWVMMIERKEGEQEEETREVR